MGYFVEVILPILLAKPLTYQINKEEANYLQPGMRVAVPLKKTKIYAGLVLQVHQNAPQHYKAKTIDHILDETPIVQAKHLKFWKWIAEYYMCSLSEVMRAALPSAFLLESQTLIQKDDTSKVDASQLQDDEYLVIKAFENQSIIQIQELMGIVDKKNVLPLIQRLLEKKLIRVHERIYEKYKPKLTKYIRLQDGYKSESALKPLLKSLSKAPRQREVLLNLFTLQAKAKNAAILLKDLQESTRSSQSIITALAKKGILEIYQQQTNRITFQGSKNYAKTLSEAQQTALEEIQRAFRSQSVCLLHGVTASGKTEIYIQLIQEALGKNQQVLYLLPEIALTTQLITRLQLYFGDQLTVFHSKYSIHERVEAWNNVNSNAENAQLIIGVRSAIFLPFCKLGLIIIDEEHETTFKQQEPAPRYHARDSAVVLASLFGAKTLLGSASPAIETYANARNNKYGLVKLTARYGNSVLPNIHLVDLKEKRKKKLMQGHFSDTLVSAITTVLEQKEQLMIFQNRRGYSPVVTCLECGHIPQCAHCDVSLTYHEYRNQLRCHYCGYHIPMQKQCAACGSSKLNTTGLGTQQVEKELKSLFPNYKVARMDQDTTRGKYGYERILSKFEEGSIDILVGTQMITKGLDFSKVSLVGVLQADQLLYFPDFRAQERSFQLLLQVGGRSGRAESTGNVYIQTANPYQSTLKQVAQNDYIAMYAEQMKERELHHYPPFFRLIRFTTKHKDYNKVNEAMAWFAKAMRNLFQENILGPEFPAVARIRNQYHKNLILKIPKNQSISKTKNAIQKVLRSFESIPQFKGVLILVNVDP